MTTLATIVALLAMPLNIWFYGRSLETEHLVIPYVQMSFTLILITIPVIMGMFLNWKLPKFTPYITKVFLEFTFNQKPNINTIFLM